jgi:hypothetical protein
VHKRGRSRRLIAGGLVFFGTKQASVRLSGMVRRANRVLD